MGKFEVYSVMTHIYWARFDLTQASLLAPIRNPNETP